MAVLGLLQLKDTSLEYSAAMALPAGLWQRPKQSRPARGDVCARETPLLHSMLDNAALSFSDTRALGAETRPEWQWPLAEEDGCGGSTYQLVGSQSTPRQK